MMEVFSITRRGVLAGGVGMAGLAFAADSASAAVAPKRGGTMIYARYADSLFLDPVLTDANVDIWVMNSIYDTLLLPTIDGKGVQEGLATHWAFGNNGHALTLTLRQGVKFSDGSPLTAQDVAWSLNRARNPKLGPWGDMVGSIGSVEIKDAKTVVLHLKHPDPTILPALAMFNTGIMPQKLFEAAPGKNEAEKAKAFGLKPVGSGPFMLVEWQRGQVMKLKRNPHYWRNAPDGKPYPYLDALEFPVIPDDATRILKLKSGEVHGTEFVPYSRVKELQADPALHMELWPSTKVSYITFNVRPKLKNGTANPLSDVRVRQALNYAINKEAIIAVTTLGLGKPQQSFMSSATPLAALNGQLYPYNLAKAKALLKAAGHANGLEVSCLSLAGNQDWVNNMTAVQQMWAAVGVKLKIEQLDNPSLVARYRAEDFQMRVAAWTDDIADPSEITSYFAYYPNIHSLHSGYEDKAVDALFEKSQQEIDPAKRRAEYADLQKRYNEAAPIAYLYETPYPVAFRKNAHGFVQIPLGNNYFYGAFLA